MIKLSKAHLILFSILLLAAFLRFYQLSTIPVGFNDDEAAFGYNAYSILKTGHDEWGRLLPFPFFESFGDWKLVFYLYLTVPSVALLGLTETATRLPSTLIGLFAIISTYLLAKELFSKKVAQVAALFLAISPWHIIASRNAFESDLLIFFISFATYLFIRGLKNFRFLVFSTITFAICFYIYRSAWLFIPPFAASLLFINRTIINKYPKKILIITILFLVLIFPLIPNFMSEKGRARFSQESFLKGVSRSGIINRVNEARGQCILRLNNVVCTMIYNKSIFFAKTYVDNYFENLSYRTYFDRASNTGFQSFATRSVFNFFELPLLLLGIILISFSKINHTKILLIWILMAPIGASIAGSGNYGRINLIMPAPQIISAYALIYLLEKIKSKSFMIITSTVIALIFLFSTVKLVSDIFIEEPHVTSRFNRYGYKQLFNFLQKRENGVNKIFISKKIDNSHQYIQYLFFQKIDPKLFQSKVQMKHEDNGWVNVENLGKYYFSPSRSNDFNSKSLIVLPEGEDPSSANKIETIRDLKGDRLFEIYKF